MRRRPAHAHRDPGYRQRLRKDRRSNAAAILGGVAARVEGTHHESRANPLYWILMVPVVWLVDDLTRFSARSLRAWTSAMIVSRAGAAFGAASSVAKGEDALLPVLDTDPSVRAAAASLILRCGSLVDREGPAR